MATFKEIQDRVVTWLRDVPADTLADIPRLINNAQIEVQRAHNFRVMAASVVLTTAPPANALGSIPSFKEPRAKAFWTDPAGVRSPVEYPPSLDYLRQRYSAVADGPPRHIYWSGVADDGAAEIEAYPLSDGLSGYEGGQYPITIPYWKYLPALAGDAATSWFTIHADEYLLKHALGMASMLNLQEERAVVYLKMAEVEAQKLIRSDKKSRLVQPQVMRYSVNAGRRR